MYLAHRTSNFVYSVSASGLAYDSSVERVVLKFIIWMTLRNFIRSFDPLVKQVFVHTELVGKLWWPIEFVMNTPSHHRVHHARNYGRK